MRKSTTEAELICRCQHCPQDITFDADRVGEAVECPGCGSTTILYRLAPLPKVSPVAYVAALDRRESQFRCRPPFVWALGAALLIYGAHAAARANLIRLDDMGAIAAGLGSSLLILPLMAFVYFAPTLNAYKRGHRERTAIFVLNLLLGWTLLGWAAAWVWSYTSQVEARRASSAARE